MNNKNYQVQQQELKGTVKIEYEQLVSLCHELNVGTISLPLTSPDSTLSTLFESKMSMINISVVKVEDGMEAEYLPIIQQDVGVNSNSIALYSNSKRISKPSFSLSIPFTVSLEQPIRLDWSIETQPVVAIIQIHNNRLQLLDWVQVSSSSVLRIPYFSTPPPNNYILKIEVYEVNQAEVDIQQQLIGYGYVMYQMLLDASTSSTPLSLPLVHPSKPILHKKLEKKSTKIKLIYNEETDERKKQAEEEQARLALQAAAELEARRIHAASEKARIEEIMKQQKVKLQQEQERVRVAAEIAEKKRVEEIRLQQLRDSALLQQQQELAAQARLAEEKKQEEEKKKREKEEEVKKKREEEELKAAEAARSAASLAAAERAADARFFEQQEQLLREKEEAKRKKIELKRVEREKKQSMDSNSSSTSPTPSLNPIPPCSPSSTSPPPTEASSLILKKVQTGTTVQNIQAQHVPITLRPTPAAVVPPSAPSTAIPISLNPVPPSKSQPNNNTVQVEEIKLRHVETKKPVQSTEAPDPLPRRSISSIGSSASITNVTLPDISLQSSTTNQIQTYEVNKTDVKQDVGDSIRDEIKNLVRERRTSNVISLPAHRIGCGIYYSLKLSLLNANNIGAWNGLVTVAEKRENLWHYLDATNPIPAPSTGLYEFPKSLLIEYFPNEQQILKLGVWNLGDKKHAQADDLLVCAYCSFPDLVAQFHHSSIHLSLLPASPNASLRGRLKRQQTTIKIECLGSQANQSKESRSVVSVLHALVPPTLPYFPTESLQSTLIIPEIISNNEGNEIKQQEEKKNEEEEQKDVPIVPPSVPASTVQEAVPEKPQSIPSKQPTQTKQVKKGKKK